MIIILKEIIFLRLEELRITSKFSFRALKMSGYVGTDVFMFFYIGEVSARNVKSDLYHALLLGWSSVRKIEISDESPYSFDEHYYSNFVKKIPR